MKAKILSSKKEFIKAEEILRDLLISKNRDPGLWMQLSEVQRAGKNIVGYHLSRGEYYTLIGDFDNALNQFQFALSPVSSAHFFAYSSASSSGMATNNPPDVWASAIISFSSICIVLLNDVN